LERKIARFTAIADPVRRKEVNYIFAFSSPN
jgi:hypothetical protein